MRRRSLQKQVMPALSNIFLVIKATSTTSSKLFLAEGSISITSQLGLSGVLRRAVPWIHFNTTQVGEIKKGGFIITNYIVNGLITAFAFDRENFYKFWRIFTGIFMIETFIPDTIRVSF
jgi:hypothetical protein